MKLFWQQNKLIICFFILLSAATVISFVDNSVENQPKVLAKILAEPAGFQNFVQENKLRTPASEPKNTKSKEQKMGMVIFCNPKSLHFKSENHLLMLELTSCAELKEKNQLWIKNETNGFKAQVFKLNSKKFRTDFIQLNAGLNNVTVEGVLKDGQKIVQTLEIQSGS